MRFSILLQNTRKASTVYRLGAFFFCGLILSIVLVIYHSALHRRLVFAMKLLEFADHKIAKRR